MAIHTIDLYPLMKYDVYFDESGDLGWTLDKPYRKGGSSRFFTISYLIIPTSDIKYITRFIRKYHDEREGKYKEVKGASIKGRNAEVLARKVIRFLENRPYILGSITVDKAKVPPRLSGTGNDDVLYNHMVKRSLSPHIASLSSVNIIPDRKSVPTGSQNSCSDLLKDELWLCRKSNVVLDYTPAESHNKDGLMFIDWIANFVWRNYEDKKEGAYQVLKAELNEEELFF